MTLPDSIEPDDMLEAVDALTKPVTHHTPITDDHGRWVRIHNTELPSLLEQLQAAIHQSMTGKGGGGNPATRGVLDSDALYRFTRIATTIREWCHIEKVTPTRDVSSNLRRWYVARLTTRDRDDTFHLRELRSWAAQIETKLDPPRRMEVTEPCPECEADTWWDETGDQHPFPIVVEYAERDPDILRTARAVCRSCAHEWHGSSQLRALRWELDTREEITSV